MDAKRRLVQFRPGNAALGRPTTMDRALAARHGVAYVHLTAFAIDVDRVFMASEDTADLPFGWEVGLCLGYVLGTVDTRQEAGRDMLDDCCAHILAHPPGEAPLGSELAFAVYLGARLGVLDSALLAGFRSWKARLKQLEAATVEFLKAPEPVLARAARHCLGTALSPPLSPPASAALSAMAEGRFGLPFR